MSQGRRTSRLAMLFTTLCDLMVRIELKNVKCPGETNGICEEGERNTEHHKQVRHGVRAKKRWFPF